MVLFALWVSIASAVQPIKVQGSEFVNSITNQRFQVIGVAYDCHILEFLLQKLMESSAINQVAPQVICHKLGSIRSAMAPPACEMLL